jgi:hypothetical protein
LESFGQPYHYALGAAVPLYRQATMGVEGDMHASAMYGLPFLGAKGRTA